MAGLYVQVAYNWRILVTRVTTAMQSMLLFMWDTEFLCKPLLSCILLAEFSTPFSTDFSSSHSSLSCSSEIQDESHSPQHSCFQKEHPSSDQLDSLLSILWVQKPPPATSLSVFSQSFLFQIASQKVPKYSSPEFFALIDILFEFSFIFVTSKCLFRLPYCLGATFLPNRSSVDFINQDRRLLLELAIVSQMWIL